MQFSLTQKEQDEAKRHIIAACQSPYGLRSDVRMYMPIIHILQLFKLHSSGRLPKYPILYYPTGPMTTWLLLPRCIASVEIGAPLEK